MGRSSSSEVGQPAGRRQRPHGLRLDIVMPTRDDPMTKEVLVDRFDFAIIGAGPAGEAAAYEARARDASVAVIDRDLFGGSCPFWGCIPSKSLLHAADRHAAGGDYPWSRASDRRDYIVDRARRELVGAAIAAPDASAAIHECVLAIKARVDLTTLADTIHAFPSTSRILNGLFDDAAKAIPPTDSPPPSRPSRTLALPSASWSAAATARTKGCV